MLNRDIEYALKQQLGNARDNLVRAKAAARKCDPSELWGESGQTLQKIIDEYAAEVTRWEWALAEAST